MSDTSENNFVSDIRCVQSRGSSTMKQITVLLAEDHTIVRQGLRLLVEADGDIEIVGEAKTGR